MTSSPPQPITLVWLRRDLRLHDNAALARALEAPHPVQPVFIFDTDILSRFTNPADRRITFIARTLAHLHAQLRQRGGGLLVLHGRAHEMIPRLAHILHAARIVAAEDYEPHTQSRDMLVGEQASLELVKDHVLFAPQDITRNGVPYKVYTPYAKAWRAALTPASASAYMYQDTRRYAEYERVLVAAQPLQPLNAADADAMLEALGYQPAALGEWDVEAAQRRLQTFIAQHAQAYPTQRNMLAQEGTSKLSPYLRFGLLSVREVLSAALAHGHADTWVSELIWREFYMMILAFFPESATQEWNAAYRGLAWREDAEQLAAWKEGRTGYPVVDAAMRQLLHTGWMHNRARMIVASFLTKDLLLDWRLGEEHFAQYLMDYELASNAGGWQWCASTGTDAQPYFRVFNPYLQSKKFDPDGAYIKRYVPELGDLKGDDIHCPPPLMRPRDYPAPIVDHSVMRAKAIALFKQAAPLPAPSGS